MPKKIGRYCARRGAKQRFELKPLLGSLCYAGEMKDEMDNISIPGIR